MFSGPAGPWRYINPRLFSALISRYPAAFKHNCFAPAQEDPSRVQVLLPPPLAALILHAQVILGADIPFNRRQSIPMLGLPAILRHPFSIFIQRAKAGLGHGMPLLRRQAVQPRR